jgi:two-component system chemotaxis response regulator CheY
MATAANAPIKVLLVDDSTTMLLSLRGVLEAKGYGVDTAADGVLALAKLKAGLKPQLILTDIHMPNMDGLEFIRETRKLLRFVPIVALTTESRQSRKDEAKRNGATGWLVKPVGAVELLALVRQLVPGAA